MKVLHTSDWHIGRSLYGRKQFHVFETFFDWLLGFIEKERVEVLLVSGDVFDSGTPGNRAQELYYRFLGALSKSSCRHVVVTSGNHDSPSFLNAPKTLLKSLNVHVVGEATENPEDEVLLLSGESGKTELVVCAVPFLRDRDVREAEAGESMPEKEKKASEGIAAHYGRVAEAARKKISDLDHPVPVIAMGHLFATGGEVAEGDGVRELYVGSLSRFAAERFPAFFDYIALGHLHIPQKIGNSGKIIYSGSPLPMGFGERDQKKSLCLLEFEGKDFTFQRIPVPVFQELLRVEGGWPAIESLIAELVAENSSAWLEVLYTGEELVADLRKRLSDLISGSNLEILKIRTNKSGDFLIKPVSEMEMLKELVPEEIFERCLEAGKIPEEQREALRESYGEILKSLMEEDLLAHV